MCTFYYPTKTYRRLRWALFCKYLKIIVIGKVKISKQIYYYKYADNIFGVMCLLDRSQNFLSINILMNIVLFTFTLSVY